MSEAIASKEERLVRYNANIAAADKDPQLSPETGKPLSKVNTIRFGAGFLLFGVLWMSGLGIVSAVLLPMHYKTIEGADPDALVGIVNAFTAVASLVANLMFGNFSDRSRSRFGRRTPWIVFGAVLGGVTLFLTGTTHNAVLLTIFYCACMFGLNCMIAPLVAVLSDRVPVWHPRHHVRLLWRRLHHRYSDRHHDRRILHRKPDCRLRCRRRAHVPRRYRRRDHPAEGTVR